MTDRNECNLSGTVESFQIVPTKTGTPMIKFFLLAGKEKVSVVAFRDLADQTRLSPGDRAAIMGTIQSTSWEGKDGVKRYGFQIIASEITLEDVTPATAPPTPPPPDKRAPAPLNQPDLPF
jgi:single-stranded DNA-binding protein